MKSWRTAHEEAAPAPRPRPAGSVPERSTAARRWARALRLGSALLIPIFLIVLLAVGIAYEASTSRLQALLFSRLAGRLSYVVAEGPSFSLILPHGPADQRQGYTQLDTYSKNLTAKGFRITRQARFSPTLLTFAGLGLNPPYEEKHVVGLRLVDRNGLITFDGTNRRHQFTTIEDIPDPIVAMLLFVENRELFIDDFPYRNPAVEWDRLAHVMFMYLGKEVGVASSVQGGSTLATQIEKYRHSAAGLTSSPTEKLKQITSASVRAYRNGMDTRAERRRIVLNYLNTMPLAAVPGYGEVNGLGEAMWGWFGKDIAQIKADLAEPMAGPGGERHARTLREIVALLIANRAPSDYLLRDRDELERLVDVHLGLMATAGVISPGTRDAARAVRLDFNAQAPPLPTPPFAERKAANAVRSQLLALLDESSFYKLDRLDLSASTTIDGDTQRKVTAELARLTDPDVVAREGLRAPRLLESGDPSRVIYSFTLYECLPEANVVRVQADNLGQPFDVNDGMKLDLGSTAKLRTLTHYLMVIAEIYAREQGGPPVVGLGAETGLDSLGTTPVVGAGHDTEQASTDLDTIRAGASTDPAPEEEAANEATADAMSEDETTREALSPYSAVPDLPEGTAPARESVPATEPAAGVTMSAEFAERAAQAKDPLTRWVNGFLAEHPAATLEEVIAASLDRRFSASPHESFFTGGGLHTFVNFNRDDNDRIMTLRVGLRNSVNLVFIRLMREIVKYHQAKLGYDEEAIFRDRNDPVRKALLDEFVAHESHKLLWRYYHRYRGKSEAEAAASLFGRRLSARNLAIFHYYLNGPDSPPAALATVARAALGEAAPDSLAVLRLAQRYGRSQLNLQDAAYLAQVHALEIWTAATMIQEPEVEWPEFAEASAPPAEESYAWLYSRRAKRAQDVRIRILLEAKSFEQIHEVWQRLGYPFGSLVPSLATAIGSSADRPTALAELIGIILRDGERVPMQRMKSLEFAVGTPYETHFTRDLTPGEQVMPPAVAAALRPCLLDVVENGTARRAHGAIKTADGEIVPIGGKTGSGDNRVKSFARGGRLIDSRVVSRTASFAFFIGNRFFGVVTAYVSGAEAADYGFTSSLPTQIVRILGPALTPLILDGSPAPPADDSPTPLADLPPALQAAGAR